MGRRIASQVHQQVSRLMRANYIRKEPAWFQAVLDNPPLVLPPKQPPVRTDFDTRPSTSKKLSLHRVRPLPIYYIEDDVRRQFFKDHPFESFRPVTLAEADRIEDPHPINCLEWTRLRQRGRSPTSDDAVKFCLNLYQYHGLSLSDAYAKAVAQFRTLRSEHHIATTFAVLEAEFCGSVFGSSEIEKAHELQKKHLNTWSKQAELDEAEAAARKRWKSTVGRTHGADQWTKGEQYVRLWQEGNKPNYMPALTEPVMSISQAPSTPSPARNAARSSRKKQGPSW